MNRGGSDAKGIFTAALEHAAGAERAAYLAAACGGDDALRRRVEELLAAHEQASDVLGASGDPDTTLAAADLASAAAGSPATEPDEPDRTTAHAPSSGDSELTTSLDGRHERESGGLAAGERLRYFGDYEVRRELGRGGMGVVYEARQVSLNRPVALKMVRAGLLAGDDELRRFQNEAEAVALLDHPGIVPIYEVGQHDGQHFFAMKLVPGGSLVPMLDRYRADPRAAASLVAEAADAVAHAHARGILHRDLKPANLLVDDQGHPHVTDFGLAKRVEADVEFTQSGAILGTPAYMSPEQATGRRGSITTATDVYGLGAVLYALLTGRAPFGGDSVVETIDAVRTAPPEPPGRLNAAVPRDLEVICLKCLEKDAHRRYATARALADDLERFLEGRPIAARPVGSGARLWMWSRRNPWLAGLTATAAALAVAAIAGLSYGYRTSTQALHREEGLRAASDAAREQSERLLYAAEANLMYRDYADGSFSEVHRRLDELKPTEPGRPDRRGIEWYLMQSASRPELRELRGHEGRVNSVKFSPDGQRLVTAGRDGTIRLWDARSGSAVSSLQVDQTPVGSASFSPDGRLVATASADGVARILDVTSGRELHVLRGHKGFFGGSVAVFSPDGRRLATLGSEGTARLWEVASGRELMVMRGHGDGAYNVHFSPDGRHLATGGMDGVRLWDVETGQEVAWLRDRLGDINSRPVGFSPDGRRLATFALDSTSMRVWDLDARRELSPIPLPESKTLRVFFSPDWRRFACVHDLNRVRVFDVETGREVIELRGHYREVVWIDFSPDGRRLATTSREGPPRIWDLRTSREAVEARSPAGPLLALAFSPDGSRVASAGQDGVPRIWDSDTGRLIGGLRGHQGHIYDIAYSPDGRRLAAGGRDGTVRIWDAQTLRELSQLGPHGGMVNEVAFSPDGRRLGVATSGTSGLVQLWDTESGRPLGSLGIEGIRSFESLAFSPDGRQLAAGGTYARDGAGGPPLVAVWDVETGEEAVRFAGHRGMFLYDVAYSPDGRLLASSGDDGTVRLWDARTGRERLALTGQERVESVQFTADGRRLVTAGLGDVRLWDVATGREVATLSNPTTYMPVMAISPNGQRLAIVVDEARIRIWDARRELDGQADRRDALGLVRFLLGRVDSEQALREAIMRDATISEPVRALALEQAGPFWSSEVELRAEEAMLGPLRQNLLKAEAVAAVRVDPGLSPEVRSRALEMIAAWRLAAQQNDVSWPVVARPGQEPAAYRRALRLIEEACRGEPNSGELLNTLGVAQYRCGLDREAVETLRRSNDLNRGTQPADLAFLAMALLRLDRRDEALATLERLRVVMRQPPIAASAENAGFLREAEALFETDRLDAAFPADPFASDR